MSSNSVLDVVDSHLYSPDDLVLDAPPEVVDWLKSEHGKDYVLAKMQALLAKNYISNMQMNGSLTNSEFKSLLAFCETREGIEQLGAHMVFQATLKGDKFQGLTRAIHLNS